jgi:hypothetical protein
MTNTILAGIVIVNLALIAYSVAVILEQKTKLSGNSVLTFLSLGVLFDITATVFMIMGSTHTALSSHGIFGYSALLAMFIDCILLWKHRLSNGQNIKVSKSLHLYSRFAYIWWLLAYFTGIIIVSLRHTM